MIANEVVKGGSMGHGTTVPGHFDVDLVLYSRSKFVCYNGLWGIYFLLVCLLAAHAFFSRKELGVGGWLDPLVFGPPGPNIWAMTGAPYPTAIPCAVSYLSFLGRISYDTGQHSLRTVYAERAAMLESFCSIY